MVLFDSRFRSKYRNVVRKARAEKIRCVRLEQGLFYVARRAANHGQYLVSVVSTNSGMFANCRAIYGAACPSYGVCVHVAVVFERMVAEGHKLERAA